MLKRKTRLGSRAAATSSQSPYCSPGLISEKHFKCYPDDLTDALQMHKGHLIIQTVKINDEGRQESL